MGARPFDLPSSIKGAAPSVSISPLTPSAEPPGAVPASSPQLGELFLTPR